MAASLSLKPGFRKGVVVPSSMLAISAAKKSAREGRVDAVAASVTGRAVGHLPVFVGPPRATDIAQGLVRLCEIGGVIRHPDRIAAGLVNELLEQIACR